jgi:hypothetical protein
MKGAAKTSGASNAKSAAGKTGAQTAATPAASAQQDAETLLRDDHRRVEKLFEQYKTAEESDKSDLAEQICKELIVHTKLEEEIFYPACREKNVEDDALDEAQVEHDGAKVMIAELMNGSPEDDYYDAKVTVLSEYIKHHVSEEEKPSDGIFAKARKAGVDMNALGPRIQARKTELMDRIDSLGSKPPQPRSLDIHLGSNNQYSQETYPRPRYTNDRDRDQQGRFMSDDDNRGRSMSRGGYSARGSRDDDDDYRGRSRSNDRERDEQGRFMSDDDDYRSRGMSRRGYSSRSSRDDDDYRGRSSQSNNRERDEQGRFMSDDDDYRGGGRGHGGWFGDPEGHSEAAERGWEGRGMSRGSRSSTRSSRDDDDDYRGRGRGHGGWFGDPEGHSEAAERGWEGRGMSRGSRSSMRSSRDDDDDYRGRGRGHGGWFGDPEGHSEASRRGWQDR